jgi:multidrug efflux system outer membrane protein
METTMTKLLSLVALLALSGCLTLPTLRQPAHDLPASPTVTEGKAQHLDSWWTRYNDPALNTLVDEALTRNTDLKLAAARIEEARANLGLAEGARRPLVTANAGAARNRSSELGNFTIPDPTNDKFTADVSAAYEVDFWGRYSRASEAARADLLASELGREVVRNSLTAGVASTWFGLRALDAQLSLADQTLANRRDWLKLQALRYKVGEISELELRQAEAELAAIESSRTQLVRAQSQQETALGLLVGRSPRELAAPAADRATGLPAVPDVPAGLPSDLLARRPDIRQAEAALTAADARIAEAKAAIYPSLSLTANLGSESKQLSDLFSGQATVWGLAANLAQTLYNAGRTEAKLKATAARREQALIAYEQTLQQAFKETLDALVASRQTREQAEAESRRVAAQRRATQLAELRYKAGEASHLDVLDAQRNLYAAEQSRLSAEQARLTASADLFRALGGGFGEK